MLDSSFQSKKEKFDIERHFSNKILSFHNQDDSFNQSVAEAGMPKVILLPNDRHLNFSQNWILIKWKESAGLKKKSRFQTHCRDCFADCGT